MTGSEQSTGAPELPRITIQDLRSALASLAPHSPKLMADYFIDWVEAQSPHLSGVGLAKEILAIGAHLVASPSEDRVDRLAHLNG